MYADFADYEFDIFFFVEGIFSCTQANDYDALGTYCGA